MALLTLAAGTGAGIRFSPLRLPDDTFAANKKEKSTIGITNSLALRRIGFFIFTVLLVDTDNKFFYRYMVLLVFGIVAVKKV
jgi:hypothetical protein